MLGGSTIVHGDIFGGHGGGFGGFGGFGGGGRSAQRKFLSLIHIYSYNEIAKETSVGDLYSSKISLDTVGSIDDNEFEKIYNETKIPYSKIQLWKKPL